MKTLYIPLQFWFCRNPGLAIPLIALQYHEVRINVDFEIWENCVYAEITGDRPVRPDALSLAAASIYIDYVYLDTEERRRFAQQSHEYLIEQVQYTGAESITSSSNKIQLNFNHPVKELVWVVQRDSFVDCSFQTWVGSVGGQQPFNYSDDFSTEGIIMSLLATGTSTTATQATMHLGNAYTGNCFWKVVTGTTAQPVVWCFWFCWSICRFRYWCQLPTCQSNFRFWYPLRRQEPCRSCQAPTQRPRSFHGTRRFLFRHVYNLTNTTPVALLLVSTYTPLLSALKNTNLLALATFLVLTKPLFNSLCP
jgi:hypothetical protein